MPLSNAQFDTIMRRYDETRERHRRELDMRTGEIYQVIPEISALDDEAASRSMDAARARIADPKADLTAYSREMSRITGQRRTLLTAHGYPPDYLEMQYDCPVCRDTGFTDGEYCSCFRKNAIETLYGHFGLSEILSRENFDSFSFDWYSDTMRDGTTGLTPRETAEKACADAQEFVRALHPGSSASVPDNNLYIYGNTGVGKTFLAHSIAKEALDRGLSVLFFSAGELMDLCADVSFGRDTGGTPADHRLILSCDLLVIDDLGTEFTNSFVGSELFRIIDGRIRRNVSTVISTNLAAKELSGKYSERVFSRIMSHYRLVRLIGNDIRIQKKLSGGKA